MPESLIIYFRNTKHRITHFDDFLKHSTCAMWWSTRLFLSVRRMLWTFNGGAPRVSMATGHAANFCRANLWQSDSVNFSCQTVDRKVQKMKLRHLQCKECVYTVLILIYYWGYTNLTFSRLTSFLIAKPGFWPIQSTNSIPVLF